MDIPLADQIVQVGHTCLEAGFKFRNPHKHVHLVVIGVESESHLFAALERIKLQGIQFVVFYEPDEEMSFTAACTEPLSAIYRKEFRNFRLWEPPREASQS
jgi:hypothetical protein